VHKIISLILYANMKNCEFLIVFLYSNSLVGHVQPLSNIIREEEVSCGLEIAPCLKSPM
jgi:hypothetical protein